MSSDERMATIRQTLGQRLSWVRCAMESIYHRHNASAMMRSADAFGVMDIHFIPGKFKPSQGASRGAQRWLQVHNHPTTAEAIGAIQQAGYALWVADFDAQPVSPEDLPLDRPVCLWFGAELEGVSPEARAAADGVVTIPMRGFSQSLNVAVATALVLHTVCERARKLHGERALLDPDTLERIWTVWRQRETKE